MLIFGVSLGSEDSVTDLKDIIYFHILNYVFNYCNVYKKQFSEKPITLPLCY